MSRSKPRNKTDIYQTITDKIVKELEEGDVPWLRPWKTTGNDPIQNLGAALGWPMNGLSGNYYSGVNILSIWIHEYDLKEAKGQPSIYVTFNQAKKLGGSVKLGEKGCQIIGYKKGEREVETDEGDPKKKSYVTIFTHTIFHIS